LPDAAWRCRQLPLLAVLYRMLPPVAGYFPAASPVIDADQVGISPAMTALFPAT